MDDTKWSVGVSPSYAEHHAHAMRVLAKKQKHDGIAPYDRVAMTLMEMFSSKVYSKVLQVDGLRRRYGLVECLPGNVSVRNGGIGLHMTIPAIRYGIHPGIQHPVVMLAAAIAYDMDLEESQEGIPWQTERVLAAGVCFTAAVVSRRWKSPFGTKFLAIAGG